jgi:hypothetical protein
VFSVCSAPGIEPFGKAAGAVFDMLVDGGNDFDLVVSDLVHAVKKCACDVHGVAFIPLGASV